MTENELVLILRRELQPIKDSIRDTRNDLRDLQLSIQNLEARQTGAAKLRKIFIP